MPGRFVLVLVLVAFAALAAGECHAASGCYAQDCEEACGSSWTGFTTVVDLGELPELEESRTPIAFVDPADGLRHRLIATQQGKIWVWDAVGGGLTSYLDLTARVLFDFNERGLLALAVDPDFETTGELYVLYTGEGTAPGSDGDVVVERYTRLTSSTADPTSNETILVISHSSADNHNGGWLAFGPDGMLYVSFGDGGGGCDSTGPNGQSTGSLKGKLLRLDVRGVDPGATAPECGAGDYSIPLGNPFSGVSADCGEIWAYGLRNPFRFSFDRANGDLWIGDVGQSDWEEVDFLAAGYYPLALDGAINFGWKCREGCEGRTCGEDDCGDVAAGVSACGYPKDVDPSGAEKLFWDPVLCHDNRHVDGSAEWQSVIGGYRYRGTQVSALAGRYFYGDAYCGQIWRTTSFDAGDPAATTAACWHDTGANIYSFAEDEQGELYVVLADGRVNCIHAQGGGCPWSDDARVFEDGFEGGDTSSWSATGNEP